MWDGLAQYLTSRSQEICRDNGCQEDDHCCESNAYITKDGSLVDICAPDFFQGWSSFDFEAHGMLAVVSLPWEGTGDDLKKAVFDDVNQ